MPHYMTFSSKTSKHILFTGGGSSGHVTPNIALIKEAEKRGWQVSYAGTENGIERQLIEPLGIPYYVIDSAKLQRRLTLQNLVIPFKVMKGIRQAYQLCRRIKPDVVFSKGGFVAVPIVIGAWLNKIPVISHESDLTPGLANRLSYPFAQKVAVSFPESVNYFKKKNKVVYTGTPVREAMLNGNAEKGRAFLGFENDKPLMLIYGGGLGSIAINQAIRRALPELLKNFNMAHCCGKGKTDAAFDNIPGYRQFDYLNDELPDVMVAADFVISRAGANSIYELVTLGKPNVLIPLSKKASRGDQIDNAEYFKKLGLSEVLLEENLTPENLLFAVHSLREHRAEYQTRLNAWEHMDARKALMGLFE